MSLGERLIDRYIPTPPAASGWLEDGAPFDAGSAMIAHSNLSHLAERNTRLLGHTPLGGEITFDSTVNTPWAEVIDASRDTSSDFLQITWGDANSRHFGPIALAHTRLGTAPAGFYPRKVRVVLQAHKSTQVIAGVDTDLVVMAVLTGGPDCPLRAPVYAQASTHRTAASSGAWVASLTLDVGAPVRPSASWRSRGSGLEAPANVVITPAWVWVGWYSTTIAGGPDRVESVSAFEVY